MVTLDSDYLDQLEDAVCDEKTFLVFLKALVDERLDEEELARLSPSDPYGPGVNGWEHDSIGAYLEAAWSWAEASKNGLPSMPKEGNPWKRMAQILHAGKIYE